SPFTGSAPSKVRASVQRTLYMLNKSSVSTRVSRSAVCWFRRSTTHGFPFRLYTIHFTPLLPVTSRPRQACPPHESGYTINRLRRGLYPQASSIPLVTPFDSKNPSSSSDRC